jgi:hypothetical protein
MGAIVVVMRGCGCDTQVLDGDGGWKMEVREAAAMTLVKGNQSVM